MRRSFLLLLSFALIAACMAGTSGCADSPPLQLPTLTSAQKDRPLGTSRNIQFVGSYSEALEKASAAGKPILVFFSTPECIYCREMADKTFRDPQIVDLAEQFVCVRVRADQDPQVCDDFHVEAFPTIQFMAADGSPLHRVLGKKDPKVLAVQMHAALDGPHAQTVFRTGSVRR